MKFLLFLFFSILLICVNGCASSTENAANPSLNASKEKSVLANQPNTNSETASLIPIQLDLMASDVKYSAKEFVGHAFMCVAIPTGSGSKEDCYGFYPYRETIRAFIGGPGVIESEFQKNPGRFQRVTVTLKRSINEEQRRKILELVNQWNGGRYNLLDESCIDFVNEVAAVIGLNRPARVKTDLPEQYLKKLVAANP